MSFAIHTLHWDGVSVERVSWLLSEGRLFAIWPAPFHHDACMQAAGFSEFADHDESWSAEFVGFCEKLLDVLSEYGPPIVRQGEYPSKPESILDRIRNVLGRHEHPPEPTLTDMVVAAASSDEFATCIIDFGAPAQASLRVSDGHEIMWLHLMDPNAAIESVLARIAEGRPVQHTELDWEPLSVRDYDPEE